jgi:monoamine oxidase
MAARAYSFKGDSETTYSGYISTWEGEPGNPSPLGVMVNYNGGFEARNLASTNLHGPAAQADVDRFLEQANKLWGPGLEAFYNYKALVSNWIEDPLAMSAFTSPSVGTMTSWWGAQWEPEGNLYFAGEAYDEEYWSYMNGAVLSGERVAKEIHMNY